MLKTRDEVRAASDARAMELWSTTLLSVAHIAREVGMSSTRVWKLARASDLRRPARPQPSEEELKARRKELRESGRPPREKRAKPIQKKFWPASHFGTIQDGMDAARERNEAYRQRERALVTKLWNDGIALKAITIRTGLSEQQIRDRVKKWGLIPRKRGQIGHAYQEIRRGNYYGATSAQRQGRAADWWRRT